MSACATMVKLGIVILACAVLLSAAEPVAQPLPFSHKRHSTLGLKCVECHPGAKDKEHAGLPPVRTCLFCHVAVKADSPAIRKLDEAKKSGQPIGWARVYRVPGFVFFSHGNHAKAGVDCSECHGPVAERDVLSAEVSTRMQRCVSCHVTRKASIECVLCHQLGQ
jgi:hypothetical protein